jgi:pimeloyl-ACP methyl ester carboxylesterase
MVAGRGNLAGEVNALWEYWALRADPVYRGHGVPRGDGKAVLVLPGMFGNDIYLQPLRSWLGRIGYKPTVSTININAGCSRRLIERVKAGLARQLENTESPVAIIGHSRGGMLGKAIASRLGERCSHFIALGSPVGQILKSGKEGMIALASGNSDADAQFAAPSVVQVGRRAMKFFDPDCEAPFCDCAYMRDLLAPLPAGTKTFAVYSSEDQVVSPDACAMDGATNIKVTGTHSGMVFNKAVYPHIATALAS